MSKRTGEQTPRSEGFRSEVESLMAAMGPGERVLLDEACRLLDRLDRLDALISGDVTAWAVIEWPFEDAPAVLVISSVVVEARQSTAELRQVVKQLAIPARAEAGERSGLLKLLEGGGAKGA